MLEFDISSEKFEGKKMKKEVREYIASDIEHIVDYFVNADPEFLLHMGADQSKLPKRQEWIDKLKSELEKPYAQKEYYYIIWLLEDEPIGHSNVNHIHYGESATMHLHLWERKKRKSGLGLEFLKLTIPFYFQNLKINTLVCEPYAKNVAPNRTLKKLGFDFIRTYETIPGLINFRQMVNRYELSRTKFDSY